MELGGVRGKCTNGPKLFYWNYFLCTIRKLKRIWVKVKKYKVTVDSQEDVCPFIWPVVLHLIE